MSSVVTKRPGWRFSLRLAVAVAGCETELQDERLKAGAEGRPIHPARAAGILNHVKAAHEQAGHYAAMLGAEGEEAARPEDGAGHGGRRDEGDLAADDGAAPQVAGSGRLQEPGQDGFGFAPGMPQHTKVPQLGMVVIADDVEIGANVAVDRGAIGPTIISKGTKIDNLTQIAHNVQLGEHCILCGQVGISGSTKVGNYSVLAGQVGLAGHLKLGNQVTVGVTGLAELLPRLLQLGKKRHRTQQVRQLQRAAAEQVRIN